VAMEHRRNHDKIDLFCHGRHSLVLARVGTYRLSPSNIVLAPSNNLNWLRTSMIQERFSNVPIIVKYLTNQLRTEGIIDEFATKEAKYYFNIDRR